MAEQDVITYDNYLKVPTLLDCQHPKSNEREEVLFILTHQAFELWFKQVLRDIAFLRDTLQKPNPEKDMRMMVRAAERIVKIFKLVTQQFAVLETMSPMEFMDFRDLLSPASGFQSLQFRLIEIRLGVAEERRLNYSDNPYTAAFGEEAKKKMRAALREPTLLKLVEGWLEKTPGLDNKDFDFVNKLREQVTRRQAAKGKTYEESGFASILDEKQYKDDFEKGNRRISRKAFLGALMTCLYREEPFFNQNYALLKLLMDIEEAVWMWRSNHVMMVHRMIGTKPGTGGSTGVGYLRETLTGDNYRVFMDLFNVSTFLLPTRFIPPLTPALKHSLAFVRDQGEAGVARDVGAMGIH